MKHCPQCNRVESDDALAFCRVDGTALISESGSITGDAGTVKCGFAPVSSEIGTSILPQRTNADISRPTAPTTVLPAQPTGATSALTKPKRRTTVIAIAVVITAVVAAVTAMVVDSYLSRNTGKSVQSIAVMPFVNASGNADLEYLSDGMTETLISSLTQLPNLSVKARSSVFRYKGKEIDTKTIGRELNVQAIVTGRVAQRGDQLTLSLELVDVATENAIWSQQYPRKQTDLVALQSEIARDVSGKLKSKLSRAEVAKVEKTYTSVPEAYQLYLKGRYQWNRRTGESLKQAVEFYKQAIEKDPNYAQAYAGLASSYIYFPNYTIALPKDSMPQAKAASMRALELDDSLAEAHVVLGRYRAYFEWDRDGGEREVRRAIELDPNFAWAHTTLAAIIAKQKRFDEAIAEAKRAEELEPLALSLATTVAERFSEARRFDESIAQSKKLLPMDPNYANTHWNLGLAYLGKGLYQESITSYQKYCDLNDDPLARGYMALAHAKLGHRDEAAKLLDWLKQESSRRYVPSVAFALTYIALGQKDEAFVWLEKDVTDRTGQASSYAVEPALDDVRDDPRFKAMLRRMNLPE